MRFCRYKSKWANITYFWLIHCKKWWLNYPQVFHFFRLNDWEEEINVESRDSALLKVENDVDLEGPPRHMTFINAYMVNISLYNKINTRTDSLLPCHPSLENNVIEICKIDFIGPLQWLRGKFWFLRNWCS